MVKNIPENTASRLTQEKNIWIGTVRPDGRPHLTPVWFAWWQEEIYICISGSSVKARNLAGNARIVCALEDGNSPVICEGKAEKVEKPYPDEVVAIFGEKYDWDIRTSEEYDWLVRARPDKWLGW